jgi:hypothetical protein
MQKLLIYLSAIFFSACAYKPIMIYSKTKRNVFLPVYRDTTQPLRPNSILTNNIDLETAKFLNQGRNKGSLAVFMSKADTYVEAKTEITGGDSIMYRGMILYHSKQDTVYFTATYYPRQHKISFERISEGSYSVNVTSDESDSKIRFNLRKFQNFILREDVLDLITGEMIREDGRVAKFAVLNDVTSPDYVLDCLWIVDLISEKEYLKYVKECEEREREKLIPYCNERYSIDWKFNWLKYDVVCKCKDK